MLAHAKLGSAIAASGAGYFAIFGLDHHDTTAIIVALITAAGVVIAGHNGRRIKRLEQHVRARRVVAIRDPHNAVHGPDGALYDEEDPDGE